MTANKSNSKAPRYHHGDLRSALIEAAEQLVQKQGSWNFTLREVARAAGVSHNAPYNHFQDKKALLATVATRAFRALRCALDEEIAILGRVPIEAQIKAAAVAYVTFAAREPARFRLMFSAELAHSGDDDLDHATQAAFEILEILIAAGIESGELHPDPSGTHALAAWALVHGLSSLIVDGRAIQEADDKILRSVSSLIGATLLGGMAREVGS